MGILKKIEQNMKLNAADPIARYGFTQLPNVILRNPDLSANAKTAYSLLLSYATKVLSPIIASAR